MRQTSMLRGSVSREARPGSAHGSSNCHAIGATAGVVYAFIRVVEDHSDLRAMKGAGTIVQGGRPPAVDILVNGCGTESGLPGSQFSCSSSHARRIDCGPDTEGRFARMLLSVGSGYAVGLGSIPLAKPAHEFGIVDIRVWVFDAVYELVQVATDDQRDVGRNNRRTLLPGMSRDVPAIGHRSEGPENRQATTAARR